MSNFLTGAGPSQFAGPCAREAGRVVFVEYDPECRRMLTPIYRLLLDMAIKEALGRKKTTEGNVWFVIDELRLIPHLQHVDNGVEPDAVWARSL